MNGSVPPDEPGVSPEATVGGSEGHRLAGLARLARALVPARTVVQVAEVAAHEARFALEARVAVVGRFELERGVLRVLVTAGDLAPTGGGPARGRRTPARRAPRARGAVDDATPWVVSREDPDAVGRRPPRARRRRERSALAVPIVHDGAVWGALLVRRGFGVRRFEPTDLDFAVAFAGLVSAGLGQVEHVARVRRLAYSDPLTGLGNRRLIEERLERVLGARDHGPVSVVMADVNGLKAANDALHPRPGDTALRALAAALSRAASRPSGSLAGRIGGDEFCVVVEGDAEVALAAGRGVPGVCDEVPYVRGVAVGVASSSLAEGPVSREQLLSWADEAQYAAKASGSTRPVLAGRDGARSPGAQALGGSPRLGRPPADAGRTRRACGRGACRPPRVPRRPDRGRGRRGLVAGGSRVRRRVDTRAPVVVDATAPMTLPWPSSAAWVRLASSSGVELLAGDPDAPLADVRGFLRVGLVQAGEWVVELGSDADATLTGVLPTLRALAAVAALG